MSPIETLKAVRELIAVPERWTQKAFARDANGIPITPCDREAVRFCLRGAIMRIVPSDVSRRIRIYEAFGLDDESIVKFNDYHATTHTAVLAAIDKAIAYAEPS